MVSARFLPQPSAGPRVSCPDARGPLFQRVRRRVRGGGQPGRAKEFINGFLEARPVVMVFCPPRHRYLVSPVLSGTGGLTSRLPPLARHSLGRAFSVSRCGHVLLTGPGPSCPALVLSSRRFSGEGEKVRMRVFIRSHLTGSLAYRVFCKGTAYCTSLLDLYEIQGVIPHLLRCGAGTLT